MSHTKVFIQIINTIKELNKIPHFIHFVLVYISCLSVRNYNEIWKKKSSINFCEASINSSNKLHATVIHENLSCQPKDKYLQKCGIFFFTQKLKILPIEVMLLKRKKKLVDIEWSLRSSPSYTYTYCFSLIGSEI